MVPVGSQIRSFIRLLSRERFSLLSMSATCMLGVSSVCCFSPKDTKLFLKTLIAMARFFCDAAMRNHNAPHNAGAEHGAPLCASSSSDHSQHISHEQRQIYFINRLRPPRSVHQDLLRRGGGFVGGFRGRIGYWDQLMPNHCLQFQGRGMRFGPGGV